MKQKKNRYLIDLEETRSRIALLAGILVFFLTIIAIIIKVDTYSRTNEHPLPESERRSRSVRQGLCVKLRSCRKGNGTSYECGRTVEEIRTARGI